MSTEREPEPQLMDPLGPAIEEADSGSSVITTEDWQGALRDTLREEAAEVVDANDAPFVLPDVAKSAGAEGRGQY